MPPYSNQRNKEKAHEHTLFEGNFFLITRHAAKNKRRKVETYNVAARVNPISIHAIIPTKK